MYIIMSSAHSENFISSFPIWIPFIYFSSLIAMARIPKTMLSNSVESGNPCLVSYLRRNAFGFTPFRIFSVGLLYMACITLRLVPSMLTSWRVFIINGCWILSKLLSAPIEMIMCFYVFIFFNLLIWCITLIDLHILKNPCIPVMNSNLSWYMILLMCCWILFNRISLRIFASMFISDIGL